MAELSNIKKIEYENNKKVAGYNKKVLKFKTEVLANSLLKGFDIVGKNFGRPIEAYLLAAVTYFLICFSLSKFARWVQSKVAIIK